jgi:hypothetical protein
MTGGQARRLHSIPVRYDRRARWGRLRQKEICRAEGHPPSLVMRVPSVWQRFLKGAERKLFGKKHQKFHSTSWLLTSKPQSMFVKDAHHIHRQVPNLPRGRLDKLAWCMQVVIWPA